MNPIDFQGIVSIDQPLVDQLNSYLQEKESQLSSRILHAMHPLPRESLPPVLPYSTAVQVKLAEAVEAFGKNVHKVISSQRALVPTNDWEAASRQINNALWEYLEVLEGCITELFQQLGQIGFEQWQPELLTVVDTIQETLEGRMMELKSKMQRLESLLWEYRWAGEAREGKNVSLRKLLFFWKSLLDRSLRSYLKNSCKFLSIRYKSFSRRYSGYVKLRDKIEHSLIKLGGYHVFKTLDKEMQEEFKKIFRLLKLWKLNLKTNSLPSREPIRALRSAISIDNATNLFKGYSYALRESLFERSRKFKSDPIGGYSEAPKRKIVAQVIKGYCAETHTLGAIIGKYREFS